MTHEEKMSELAMISEAWLAGYISEGECLERKERVRQRYFESTYGKFDVSKLPGGDV